MRTNALSQFVLHSVLLNSHLFSSIPLAYVDGGAGSMLLQAVLAGAFATVYGLRGAIFRLIAAVKGSPSKTDRSH